jgi:hypothetical protein
MEYSLIAFDLLTMNLQILHEPISFHLYGCSGRATNNNYTETAFTLSGKMWQVVKAQDLKNKGMNVWAYEPGEAVFAGVELEDTPPQGTGLEEKTIHLVKYAHYKHIGSYKLLQQIGAQMREGILERGFEIMLPYVEVYGHWQSDETRLETELFMCLK